MWFTLAWQSLLSRKITSLLTFVALLVSVSLLFSIEHIRSQTQENFNRTVSGIDIVVAARSSQINVLLSSVFRIGANPNGLSWETYQDISKNKQVVWTIPISLGDTYQGFPVVGTSAAYFQHYQYGSKQTLSLQLGRFFAAPNEVVIGASIANSLDLHIGQQIVLSHGSGKVSFSHHDLHPMLIVGILDATGTPVDKSLHVPLVAIDEIHKAVAPSLQSSFSRPSMLKPNAQDDEHEQNSETKNEHDHVTLTNVPDIAVGSFDLIGKPTQISAMMLKAESPFAILTLQRDLNRYQAEAISAILPQVALAELWQVIGSVEALLQVIALLVLCSSLIGLVTMLLASMHERRSEISVLRALGASPLFIASLIQAEALLISILALIGGYLVVTLSIFAAGNWLLLEYGVFVSPHIYSTDIMFYAVLVLGLTLVVAMIPTLLAYRSAKYLFK